MGYLGTCREEVDLIMADAEGHNDSMQDVVADLVRALADRIDAIERRMPMSRCHHVDEFGQLCVHELGHRGPHHASAT